MKIKVILFISVYMASIYVVSDIARDPFVFTDDKKIELQHSQEVVPLAKEEAQHSKNLEQSTNTTETSAIKFISSSCMIRTVDGQVHTMTTHCE